MPCVVSGCKFVTTRFPGQVFGVTGMEDLGLGEHPPDLPREQSAGCGPHIVSEKDHALGTMGEREGGWERDTEGERVRQ